jgi:hypothetical protein
MKERFMKTLIATLAVASILATAALAKTEKNRTSAVETSNSVTCGRHVLADPDPGIRASFLRDCGHFERPGHD